MNDTVYSSVFKKEFQDLVDLKRALGFTYHTEACAFRRIDSFSLKTGSPLNVSQKSYVISGAAKEATSLSPTRPPASARSGFFADTWMT